MSPSFNPKKDIPDLAGRVCLVTGANTGLGEATVTALAQHNPRKIYLAARSVTKAEAALARIRATSKLAAVVNIEIVELDLASFDSVKKAAQHINADTDRLDIVYLNGGISVPEPAVTKDGYELTFATNYLGHALLTQLLMPKLIATSKIPAADVRVVVISSIAVKRFAPEDGIQFDDLKTDMRRFSGGRQLMITYGQSNVARTLFAYEFAKRYPSINITSLHPGTVYTNIWGTKEDKSVLKTILKPIIRVVGVLPEEGVKTQLWCAFSPKAESGAYYEPIGKRSDGKFTRNDVLAAKLWEWTDEELRQHGSPGWLEA